MNTKMERRILQGKISLRAAAPGSDSIGQLEGYAAIFNSQSHDLGGFREVLMPGCFDSVLRTNPDVRALVNHDSNQVIGRTKNGTLSLEADGTGLFMSCALPDTQTARDLHTLISRGDVSQCSFSFKLNDGDDEWSNAQDASGQYTLRTVRNVSHLYDVSCVTYPAYENTSVSARSLHSHYFIATAPVVLVDDSDRDYIRRIQCTETGKRIAADDQAAYQADVDAFNRPHQSPYPWQLKGK